MKPGSPGIFSQAPPAFSLPPKTEKRRKLAVEISWLFRMVWNLLPFQIGANPALPYIAMLGEVLRYPVLALFDLAPWHVLTSARYVLSRPPLDLGDLSTGQLIPRLGSHTPRGRGVS